MASHNNFEYFQKKLTELECMSLVLVKDEKTYKQYVDKFVKKCKVTYKGINVYICEIEHIAYLNSEFLDDFTYNINSYLRQVDRKTIDYKQVKNLKGAEITLFINYIFALLYDTLDDLEQSCLRKGLI